MSKRPKFDINKTYEMCRRELFPGGNFFIAVAKYYNLRQQESLPAAFSNKTRRMGTFAANVFECPATSEVGFSYFHRQYRISKKKCHSVNNKIHLRIIPAK
jgi:hypothetical protein